MRPAERAGCRADSGYAGLNNVEEITDAQAEVLLRKKVHWRVAMKRCHLPPMSEGLR